MTVTAWKAVSGSYWFYYENPITICEGLDFGYPYGSSCPAVSSCLDPSLPDFGSCDDF